MRELTNPMNQNTESFDKRWVRGKIQEYISISLNHTFANSPQKLRESLEILEEPVRVGWILAGVVEIEDRKFEYSFLPTQEKRTRLPQDREEDPFKYEISEDLYREDYLEYLPGKDAVVTCGICYGSKQITSECQSCNGTGQLTCHVCKGQKYRTITCKICEGTQRVRIYANSDTFVSCSACSNGFVTEGCKTCHETGILAAPCPKCEKGQIKYPCVACEGTGLRKQIVNLRIRHWKVDLRSVTLEPSIKLKPSLPGTMEPVFSTLYLNKDELEKLVPENIPQNVWRSAKSKLQEIGDDVLQSYGEDGLYKRIKRLQVSIYSPTIIQARFLLQGRPGLIWIALGNNRKVLDHAVIQYSQSFWDYAFDLSALLSIFFLGTIFSWIFHSIFPLLAILSGGMLIFWVIRSVQWQNLEKKIEFTSQVLKTMSFLMAFLGIVLIIVLFVQMIGVGDVSSQVFPLVVLAIVTSLGILGILKSQQFGEILGEIIKTFSKNS